MDKRLFTSESVSEGHPDKVCDQIADAVLDAILTGDATARVACETVATTGLILVMGEITTGCYVDIERIVRDTVLKIGYDSSDLGFDGRTCAVLTCIDEQSPDIAQGVNVSLESRMGLAAAETGAGDQGMMFGYACDQTPELMPMPIEFAHRVMREHARVRKSGKLPFLRPDAKAQVTVEYRGGRPARVDTVVVSTQHSPDAQQEEIHRGVVEDIVRAALPEAYLDAETRYLVNPSGRFVVGGPHGDSGLSGRKIIVDTYGGYARHGGGSFSGKDPSKVDRSASYMTRYVAKNLVAAGVAREVELQIAYAIGVARPISVNVDSFGTGAMPDSEIAALVQKRFDMRPSAIIEQLSLQRPIYLQTAAYGHFGRGDLDLPWERTDRAGDLKRGL
ncbi:MAG: methionine adenosyltransferase [Christensenellales bacterium]|jgi:S-adenosylmethionine synthetase